MRLVPDQLFDLQPFAARVAGSSPWKTGREQMSLTYPRPVAGKGQESTDLHL